MFSTGFVKTALDGLARERRRVVTVLLVLALLGFGALIHRHEPIGRWLVWVNLGLLGIAAAWAACCLVGGYALIRRITPQRTSVAEQLPLGFALGVLVFGLVLFLLGICKLLSSWTFFALPLTLLALGWRSFSPWRNRSSPLGTLRRWACSRHEIRAVRVLPALLLVLGALGIVLTYAPTLSPLHISSDSAWYHLSVPEYYVAAGGIERFDEGWYMGAYPQLASWLYTWAFMLPGATVVERSLLCLQMEFFVFLGTLASIPALARKLGAGGAARWSWVAAFAFPSLIFYNLVAAADHISALFAVPVYLMLIRAWNEPGARYSALLALFLSGGFLTKYSAGILFFAPAAAFVIGRMLRVSRAVLARRPSCWRPALESLAAMLLVGLVVTSTHWLKNWIWYGSPLYPMLGDYLALRPWHVDAAAVYAGWKQESITGTSSDWAGLWRSLSAMFDFSFNAHEFYGFSHGRPMAGSLFTLLLLPLLVLSRQRALWGAIAILHVSLVFWFATHAQDRFLQTVLPVMAAVVAVTMHHVWALGRSARFALVGLVMAQLLWASDLPMWPHRHPWCNDLMARGASGLTGNLAMRWQYFVPWVQVGEKLPQGAKLLVHEFRGNLGTGVKFVSDWQPGQGGVNYGRMTSAAEVHSALRGLGVTHLVYAPGYSQASDSIAGDLRFHSYASRVPESRVAVGNLIVGTLPDQAPARTPPERVAYLGCGKDFVNGIYPFSAFAVQPQRRQATFPAPERAFLPTPAHAWAALAKEPVDFVVLSPDCAGPFPAPLRTKYELLVSRAPLEMWKKR